MEEALDIEVGRLLVATGLASRGQNGQLIYRPRATNTVVVMVTDNGSLGSVVKIPFDGSRSKSTVYQTGVWAPGIVAGPQVKQPGRQVNAMVNIADLYQLFGELTGIDVHKDVHKNVTQTVDAQPLLPYLINPAQRASEKRTIRRSARTCMQMARSMGPASTILLPARRSLRGKACARIIAGYGGAQALRTPVPPASRRKG
jgi:arylsulfatase A-like enzyme